MWPMKPLVIANPVAGRGRTRKLLPVVTDELERLGVETEIRISSGPSDPVRWATEAANDGRRVVAFGGDGMVSDILDAVRGRVPVAILPGGSGNDLARAIGIDLDVRRACAAVTGGRVTQCDAGRLTDDGGKIDRIFATIASAGFDGEATAVANRVTWAGGTLIYVYAALATLLRWQGARFHVVIDDEPLDVSGWLVAVGNTTSYGGGMRICPNADPYDGLFDITILEDLAKPNFLMTFPKVFSGKHIDHPRVRTYRGRKVRLEADRTFYCYADGEERAPLPVTLEVLPGALSLVLPE